MNTDIDITQLIDSVRSELQDLVVDVQKSSAELTNLTKNVGPEPPMEGSAAGPMTGGDEGPPPEATPTGDEGAGAGGPEEQLLELYLSMPPEELVMHYQAAKTAIFILMEEEEAAGGGAGAGPGAGSPEASPGPGRGSGPAPESDEFSKAAMNPSAANGSKVRAGSYLGKAEAGLIASLNAKVESLAKAVELVAGKPQRRGFTGFDLAKSVSVSRPRLTRAQVMEKLAEVAATEDLAKSDREKINAFALGGLDMSAVEHLIK